MRHGSPRSMHLQKGFTLIELLVVISIMAVLSVTVILTLNPADLLRQARDSTRLSDLTTLNRAISIAQASTLSGSLGSSTILYLSTPDSTSTCANLGLTPLSGGMAYRCVSAASSTRIDGTGWMPLNFSSGSNAEVISRLPVDPVNSVASGFYYQFQSATSTWKLSAKLESTKYISEAGKDGGTDPLRVERGNDLSLSVPTGSSIPGSPVMWLAADSITGKNDGDSVSTWNDQSGNNNNAVAVGASPVFRTNILNGKPVVQFTAASLQRMRATPNVNLPYTIFAVARQRGGANGRVIGAVYPSANWLLGWWNSYQDAMYAEGFVKSGTVAASTNWIQYTGKGTGSLTSFYKNGSLLAENALGTLGINSTIALSGYGAFSTEELSNCDIAEVLVYGTALNNTDRSAVEAYLNSKYNLY